MMVKTTAESFYRDTSNHALINTNKEAYKLYRMQRNSGTTIDVLQREVHALKDDISEIKKMLQQLTNRDG